LEILSDGENLNRGWENIKENFKTSAKKRLGLHELKHRKQWCDDECSRFLDQRKKAKMQWVKDPNQSSLDTLNNVRRDAGRYFRNRKKEYMKAKID
jgi:hypothetical protein